ncbi:MAG: 4-(cytidine 5'-diphospho)-2-C-methyl-D-erythritol kinase [Thermodesulfobacteriota bacterium]
MKRLRARAPAKINLYLKVLGARDDGYHELETVFQAVDLQDELIIEEGSGPAVLDVPGFPDLEAESNLVVRALRWLEAECGSPLPVRMRLTKRIPVAAGLGGGSSNAAAALLGISTLYGLGLQGEKLLKGAASLGADVSFFLFGGTAVGEGIGERITRVHLSTDYGLLLVNPGFQVSTAAVYREYSESLTGALTQGTVWNSLRKLRRVEDILHNDLQAPAETLYPMIAEARATLVGEGLPKALMSGSGPTVFGIGDSDRLAHIEARLPGNWRTFITGPIEAGILLD